MKKIFLLIVVVLPLLVNSQGRTRHQLGFLLGGGYYLGELNNTHFNNTQLAFGAFYRRSFKNFRVADRINFTYGNVNASDHESDVSYNINRNLSFKSKILELGYLVEINFRKYDVGALRSNRSTPYLFGGINYFYMSPKRGDEKLKDWSTEGQGVTTGGYSNHQVSIPFGLGLKANLSNRIAIGVEYGLRRTFTDYLDDVGGVYADRTILEEEISVDWASIADPSLDGIDKTGYQRGNSKNKDWYSFFGVYLTFQLKQNCGCSI